MPSAILSENKEKWKIFLIAGILFIGFLLRFAYLIDRTVWYDEAITIFYAQSSLSYIWHHFVNGSNPPLAYFFYHIWQVIFGNSQMSYELVAVLFGVATLFMMYRVARRLFDENTALIALALLTFSSYHLFISQQIRGYSMACFFALLSIDQLFQYVKSKNKMPLAGWFIASGIMLGVHFYTFFLFAVECLALLIDFGKRKGIKKLSAKLVYGFGALAIFAIFFAGLFLAKTFHWFPFYPRSHASLRDLALVLQSVFFLSKPLVFLSLILVAGGLVQIFRTGKGQINELGIKDHIQFLLVWLLISAVIPFFISRWIPSFFYVRYYIFSHLAFVLLTACAIQMIPKAIVRLSIVLVYVFFLLLLISDYYDDCYSNKSQKDMYQMVEREFKEGDAILHENGWTFGPSYYYHGGRLAEFYANDEFGLPTLGEKRWVGKNAEKYKRIWFFPESPDRMGQIGTQEWFRFIPKISDKKDSKGRWHLFSLKEK